MDDPQGVRWMCIHPQCMRYGMEQFKVRFAKAVEVARKARGLSQEQLGSENGIATETISNIERTRVTPTLANFVTLVEALKLDAPDLLGVAARKEKKSAQRFRLEVEADQVMQTLDDAKLKTWIRLASALADDG